MHPNAANPAAQPDLSLNIFSASAASREERNGGGDQPSFPGAVAISNGLRFARTSAAERQWGDKVQWEPSASYPVLCSVTASGPNRRPAARRRSASALPPLRGHGSSQKKCVNRGNERRTKLLSGPLPESTPWRLGAGPTRSRCECDPSRIREIHETEITTMYQNKVTLIGFLGNDAEVRSNDNRSFTTLSLATKSSYKKDGKYISHTEWHRCVVFAKKLGEFAATLKKGAHLQVEGELRSREYQPAKVGKKQPEKKTIWEIRVDSILKLDRAEKSGPEEQDAAEESHEEAAA